MVKKIKILSIVNKCISNDDGDIVFKAIKDVLDSGDNVQVSFDGIYSVPSSFINSAFLQLLRFYSLDLIKSKVTFVDSTKHINNSLKKCFECESLRLNKPLGC